MMIDYPVLVEKRPMPSRSNLTGSNYFDKEVRALSDVATLKRVRIKIAFRINAFDTIPARNAYRASFMRGARFMPCRFERIMFEEVDFYHD
jgi:hypothetical protein